MSRLKLRFLLAVDGSWSSGRAVDCLIKQLSWLKESAEVHVVNVQEAFPAEVAAFASPAQIKHFHEEEGLKALANARAKLDAAGVPHAFHVRIGDCAQVIANYAKEQGCDQIYLGTRGMGSIAGMLLGSVASKVVHLSEVPVVLVK